MYVCIYIYIYICLYTYICMTANALRLHQVIRGKRFEDIIGKIIVFNVVLMLVEERGYLFCSILGGFAACLLSASTCLLWSRSPRRQPGLRSAHLRKSQPGQSEQNQCTGGRPACPVLPGRLRLPHHCQHEPHPPGHLHSGGRGGHVSEEELC